MAALLLIVVIAGVIGLIAWIVATHTVDLQKAPSPPSVQAAAPVLIARAAPPAPVAPAPPKPPSKPAALTIAPAVPVPIAAPKLEPWEEKGWKKGMEGTTVVYEGYYVITEEQKGRKRHFRGKVKIEQGLARPYIADPPTEFFQRHPKATCLREWREKPWFWLNWARSTANVDKAILYMERILSEALNP